MTPSQKRSLRVFWYGLTLSQLGPRARLSRPPLPPLRQRRRQGAPLRGRRSQIGDSSAPSGPPMRRVEYETPLGFAVISRTDASTTRPALAERRLEVRGLPAGRRTQGLREPQGPARRPLLWLPDDAR